MNTALGVITLTVIAAHGVIFGFAQVRGREGRGGVEWLLATIICSGLACATYLLPERYFIADKIARGFLLTVLLAAMFGTFGALIIRDMIALPLRVKIQQRWAAGIGLWLALMLLAAALDDTARVGSSEWVVEVFRTPDASSVVMLLGVVFSGLALVGVVFYAFYIAHLPEVANRALFWMLNTAAIIIGLMLTASGTDSLAALGMIMLVTGIISATYVYISFRVFDIRSSLILALRTLAFVAAAAALTFAALYVALTTGLEADNAESLLVIGVIALVIAGLYVPVRQVIEALIQQVVSRRRIDPMRATREYSQRVAETVELGALLKETINTLNNVMGARRSCLILLNSTARVKDAIELLVMQPGGSLDKTQGVISVFSPVYDTLAAKRMALSQFDLEYNPKYRSMAADERAFFQKLEMSAFAPIQVEGILIGVLACGPKMDDTAFYAHDLELLATMAQQTGVALRNARLVDDLQHLNKSMQSLNKGLKAANEQLNKLDTVKTDFITIASHELRTPLAQVRGYSDIIDAMNEQGMLDQDQTTVLVNNLRKATERMEELISAMLDVSQLDVNAMDLRFTETPPESVLRMAIEPLNDAIKQRKLTLVGRGFSGLPNIQADLPRLVQAFRNIIVNAIKFTPDGGRIEIVAALQPAVPPETTDYILVEISDTGVGIDPKNLDLIFKKFFRASDPSLHSTGTYKFMGAGPGLGLTIAKGVIEGHGGKIWAESKGYDLQTFPGSVFYIRLPVGLPQEAMRVQVMSGEAEDSTNPKPPQAAYRDDETDPKPPSSGQSGVSA